MFILHLRASFKMETLVLRLFLQALDWFYGNLQHSYDPANRKEKDSAELEVAANASIMPIN